MVDHIIEGLWPDAGRAFGYSEDHTRRVAHAGQFPGAFQSGRKWSVATAPIAKVLGIDLVSLKPKTTSAAA